MKDYESFAQWLSTIIDDKDLAAFKKEVEKKQKKEGEDYDAEKHVNDYLVKKGGKNIDGKTEKQKAQRLSVLKNVSKQVSSLENTYNQTTLDNLAEEVYAEKGRVKGDTLQVIKTTSKDTDNIIKNNAEKISKEIDSIHTGTKDEVQGTVQDYLASFRGLEQVKGTKKTITQKLDDHFLTKELTKKNVRFDKSAPLSEKKKLAKENKINLDSLYDRDSSLKNLRKIAREKRINIASEIDLNKILHKTLIIQTIKDKQIFESRKEIKDKIDTKLLSQALREKGIQIDKDATPNMLRKMGRENKINLKTLYNKEKYSPTDSSEKLVVMANNLGLELSKKDKEYTSMSYDEIKKLNTEHKLQIPKQDFAGRINQIERTLNGLAKKPSLNASESAKRNNLTFELNNIKNIMQRGVEQNKLDVRLTNSFKNPKKLLNLQPYQKQYAREIIEEDRAKDFVVNLKKDLKRLISTAKKKKYVDQSYKNKLFELSKNMSPHIKSSEKKEIEFLFNQLDDTDKRKFKQLTVHQDLFKRRSLLEKKQILLLKGIDTKGVEEKEINSLMKKQGLSLFRRENKDVDEKIVTVARLTNEDDSDFSKAVKKLKESHDTNEINTKKLLDNTLEVFTQKEVDRRKKPSTYITISELYKEKEKKAMIKKIPFSTSGREEFSYLDKPIKKREVDSEINKIKGLIGKIIDKKVKKTPVIYNPEDIDRIAFLNILDKRTDMPILELELEKQWKKKNKIDVDVPLNISQRKDFLKSLNSKKEVDKLIKSVKGTKAKYLKKYNFVDIKPFRDDVLKPLISQDESYFKALVDKQQAEKRREEEKETNTIIYKLNELVRAGVTKDEILSTGIDIPKTYDLDRVLINNRVRTLYKMGVSEDEILGIGISKNVVDEVIQDVESRKRTTSNIESSKNIGKMSKSETKLLGRIRKGKF